MNAPKVHGTRCLACGAHKAKGAQEVYPYPADDYFDNDPIPALFELDCQSNETRSEFRIVTVCHECFHKLLPDMWISSDMWKELNPITPFEQLPLLEASNGTTGQVQ